MAAKLTAIFLLSGISIVAFQGCGGDDAADEETEEAVTTAAPASPTSTPTPKPTPSPTVSPTPAPTPDPCSKEMMCNCEQDVCNDPVAKWTSQNAVGKDCMMNCDDIMATPIMVIQGARSCPILEQWWSGGRENMCANCECVVPELPVCGKVLMIDDGNGGATMVNCEEILADPGFQAIGFTDCQLINNAMGGSDVCMGCTCPPPPTPLPTPSPTAASGYGNGYGFGYARALEEEEEEPDEQDWPKLAAKMGMKIPTYYFSHELEH